jgi:hypothetical protein
MFEKRSCPPKLVEDVFSIYNIRHRTFIHFCWQWAIATSVGFGISLFFLEIGEKPDLGAIEGTIGGAIVGLLQSLLLVRWIPQPWLWILANAIAWGLLASSGIGAIGWYAPRTELLSIRLSYGAMYGAIAGLWLGLWQWLILRQYLVAAWRWILIMLSGWAIALSAGWVFGGKLRALTHLFLGEVVGLACTWAIVSLISSVALTLLIRETLLYRRKLERAKVLSSCDRRAR